MLMNANDHRGYFPLAGNTFGIHDATPYYMNDPNQLIYTYFTDTSGPRPAPLPVALAPYLGATIRTDSAADLVTDYNNSQLLRIFTCPADVDQVQSGNYQVAKWIGSNNSGWLGPELATSYGFNEAVFGWCDSGKGQLVGHSRCRGEISRIPDPADVILMGDASPRGGNDGWISWADSSTEMVLLNYYQGAAGGTSASDAELFDPNRHYGVMNILFADGHGESDLMPEHFEQINVSQGLH